MLGSIADIVMESGRRVAAATGFEVSDKGSRENVVTTADLENERFLKERLTGLLPGSAFMGEEGDESPILEEGYTWIVDPIDGTMNFSRGIPEVGISVALFRDGEPYIGVVHNPFNGRLWTAEVGRGAWMDGMPIHVSDRPLEDCILSTPGAATARSWRPGCSTSASPSTPGSTTSGGSAPRPWSSRCWPRAPWTCTSRSGCPPGTMPPRSHA